MDPEARRFAEEPSPEESELLELCAVAEAKTSRQGHELEPWAVADAEGAPARRAACTRCGRKVYVRVEGGLVGMAGSALGEPCET
jgi:hypothetical protein